MEQNKKLSIAFLGSMVPDSLEYQNIAFRRSGNMAQEGIVDGLNIQEAYLTVFSVRPIASFPKNSSLFCGKKTIEYRKGLNLILIPFINLLVIKTILSSIWEFYELLIWAKQNKNNDRCIIVYNAYTPPLPLVYWIAKITGSKSVAILYDLGMPPKQLKLGWFKKLIYRCVEFFAKRYIPRLDGRIVINEAIAQDYAPNKHSILIDGGISTNITKRLFELTIPSKRKDTIFLIAGSISPINGTRLIKEAMDIIVNPNIKVWFAGNGHDLEFVKNIAKEDSRIEYKGMLDLDQLFECYKQIDVFLNLRVTSDLELYLFPSKILEYLAVGKLVLSTSFAHLEREYGSLCTILPDNRPQTIANKMEEIANLNKTELIKKGKKNRQYMLENHTWDKQALNILNYIKSDVL